MKKQRRAVLHRLKKQGTAQVGAIQRLKIAKRLQSVKLLSSTVPEKSERWTELARHERHFGIFHPFSRKSSKKLKKEILWRFFSKKSLTMLKNERGDS